MSSIWAETIDAAAAPPYGYALRRNGSCLTTEKGCGNNWADWHTCCPGGTFCGAKNTCCSTNADCSALIEADPHCANNATWDLYQTTKYICCLSGTFGFYHRSLTLSGGKPTGGHGCADEYPSGTQLDVLSPVATGTAYTSTLTYTTGTTTRYESSAVTGGMSETSSTITEPTSTGATTTEGPQTTPVTTPASDTMDYADRPTSNESNNNMGVIVGGLIGGIGALGLILALTWLLVRRRHRTKQSQVGNLIPGKHFDVVPVELEHTEVRAELYGNQRLAHELPTCKTPRR